MITFIKKYTFILFIALCACSTSEVEKKIVDFDFNQDESIFSYIYELNNHYQIVIHNKETDKHYVIEESNNQIKSLSLSLFGDSLIYIKNSPDLSEIILFDNKTKKKTTLISNNQIITETTWFGDKELVFLSAQERNAYSPIATNRPHKFDLFLLSIDSRENKQLTNLSAYSMNNISVTEENTVSFILNNDYIGNYNIENDSLVKYNVKEVMNDDFFFLSRFDICHLSKSLILYSNYRFYKTKFGEIPEEVNRVTSHVSKMKYSSIDCSLYYLLKMPSNLLYKYSNKKTIVVDVP